MRGGLRLRIICGWALMIPVQWTFKFGALSSELPHLTSHPHNRCNLLSIISAHMVWGSTWTLRNLFFTVSCAELSSIRMRSKVFIWALGFAIWLSLNKWADFRIIEHLIENWLYLLLNLTWSAYLMVYASRRKYLSVNGISLLDPAAPSVVIVP